MWETAAGGLWSTGVPPDPATVEGWSAASRRTRGLRRLEARLRAVFPLPVWRRVGALDAAGRSRLAEVVEAARRWLEVQGRWRALEPVRADIESALAALREAAARLGLAGLPASSNPEEWQRFHMVTEESAALGEKGEAAWRRREEREQAAARLRALAGEYVSACAGVPLKEGWRRGAGRVFDAAVLALADDPDPAKVVALRSALYTEPVADFFALWAEAREAETQARNLARQESAVPTAESITAEWWLRKPPGLPKALVAFARLPGSDDPLVTHLRACEAWAARGTARPAGGDADWTAGPSRWTWWPRTSPPAGSWWARWSGPHPAPAATSATSSRQRSPVSPSPRVAT